MGIQQNIRLEQSVDEYHPGWWHHFELHCPRKYCKTTGFYEVYHHFLLLHITLLYITSYLSCDSPAAKWGPLNFIRRSLCALPGSRQARRISVGWMSEQMPGWLVGCQFIDFRYDARIECQRMYYAKIIQHGGDLLKKSNCICIICIIWSPYHNWLVLWNIFYFPIQLGILSSQLTKSYFFRGFFPQSPTISIDYP